MTVRQLVIVFLLAPAIGIGYAENHRAANELSETNHNVNANTPDIEVFVRSGCPHCEKAEAFLKTLKQGNPALTISIHDLAVEPNQLERLRAFALKQGEKSLRVPVFRIGEELIVGYSDESTTGQLIRNALTKQQNKNQKTADSQSCELNQKTTCESAMAQSAANMEEFKIEFLGYSLALDKVGLPLFTLAMGLLDGFNPCSLWVLLLMISLLAPMRNRPRMFAIAGSFIVVEGIAYFIFMTAWLNLFLFIGLSRLSELIIAAIAILAGVFNIKDFWLFGRGVSLSIPESAKSDIYARIRQVLYAQNLTGALIGAIILAILVQFVELMCTSGFPALYTRILTLKQLDNMSYYGYLLVYNLAYMFDDIIVLSIGIITLSQKRLQKNEGRWLKLISGLVMVGLGIYLIC